MMEEEVDLIGVSMARSVEQRRVILVVLVEDCVDSEGSTTSKGEDEVGGDGSAEWSRGGEELEDEASGVGEACYRCHGSASMEG